MNQKNPFDDYIKNVCEAFIILVIIKAIVDGPIDFINVFKSSLIIGVLVSLATFLNEDFKDNVKQLHYGVSSMIISQFSPTI